MPRRTNEEIAHELDAIIAILRNESAPLTRDEIASAVHRRLGHEIPPRTLRRRLEDLAAAGRLAREGDGPSSAYRLPTGNQAHAPAKLAVPPQAVPAPWLSQEGAKLRAQVRQPRGARPYVTYQRAWLESYTPGTSWYLTDGMRQHLHQQGATPAGDRPAGTYAREILARLLIDLSWASSHLEGNTYTRLDTKNLIEFGQRADGKDAAEAQMILNHKEAIEFLVARDEPTRLDPHAVRTLHAILSAGLLREVADEGRLRLKPVSITGTTYLPAEDPHLIRECFEAILTMATAIPDPFERSFFLLVHLPYLQPFIDANKRTSRLAANIPLIEANLCPLTFVDIPEQDYVEGVLAVYELRRVELLRDVYLFAYERSCEQYVVARAASMQPDPRRLRFRRELTDAVVGTVRTGTAPSREHLSRWGAAHGVPTAERAAFAELALDVLVNLNDASAARFGLRPSEFKRWRDRFKDVAHP